MYVCIYILFIFVLFRYLNFQIFFKLRARFSMTVDRLFSEYNSLKVARIYEYPPICLELCKNYPYSELFSPNSGKWENPE